MGKDDTITGTLLCTLFLKWLSLNKGMGLLSFRKYRRNKLGSGSGNNGQKRRGSPLIYTLEMACHLLFLLLTRIWENKMDGSLFVFIPHKRMLC
jgi:hypothetical protein